MILSTRIRAFPLFMALPLRCLSEVTEGLTDLLCPFARLNKKFWAGLSAFDDTLAMLCDYGPLDLMDVDAGGREGRVKFRMLLR